MTDIAIIGAGPAGLSAAVNGVARGKTVRVLGYEGNYLEKAEQVDNYLGFYQVNGAQMMKSFLNHAKAMGVEPEYGKVANVLPLEDRFLLNFDGNIVEAKTVIFAIGVAKAKELPGEKEFLGRGVSYCATCDGMLYRGKRAVVCGQADDLAEEANFLHDIGVQVTVVSRAPLVGLSEGIPVVQAAVQEILGDQTAKGVLADGVVLETDVVFLLRNSIAPSALMEGLKLRQGYIEVTSLMETNIPGCFACGDCTGTPLQVSKAVGEGLIAAQQAAKYIDTQK